MGYSKKDKLSLGSFTGPQAADAFLSTFCKKAKYANLVKLASYPDADIAALWEPIVEQAEAIGLEAVDRVKAYLQSAYDTEYDGSAWFTGNLRASLYLHGSFTSDPFDCDIEFDEQEFLREKDLPVLKDVEGTYKVNGLGKGKWRGTPKKKTITKKYKKYEKGDMFHIDGSDYRGRVPTPTGSFVMTWYDEVKKAKFKEAGL